MAIPDLLVADFWLYRTVGKINFRDPYKPSWLYRIQTAFGEKKYYLLANDLVIVGPTAKSPSPLPSPFNNLNFLRRLTKFGYRIFNIGAKTALVISAIPLLFLLSGIARFTFLYRCFSALTVR